MGYQKLLYQSFLWRGLYFISTFLVNILIARYYQAAFSGWIYYITTLYAFILLLLSVCLESGIWYFVSKGAISVSRLFNAAILWTILAGFIVFFGSMAVTFRKPDFLPQHIFLLSSLSYVCGILATNYMTSIYYGRNNFLTPNVILLGCNFAVILMLLTSFYFPSSILNGRNFISTYFIMFVVQGVLLAIAVLKSNADSYTFSLPDIPEFKKLLRYSLAAFAGNVIFFLVYRVDYYFVERYCTATELGNYVQVSKIGQVLITIPSILASGVFSLTAGGQQAEINDQLPVLSRVLLLTSGMACALLAISGHWLFPWVFGNTFTSMYLPFLWLIPGILALSALYPLAAYYSGTNRIRANIIGGLIGLVVIITGDLVLIPVYGISGAAFVSSAGYIAYYVYLLWLFKKEHHSAISNFITIRRSDFRWAKNFLLNRANL